MSNTFNIGLSEEQRKLLLQGLRYVHSSVAYDIFKPTPEATEARQKKLQEIESLASQLNNANPINVPVNA
ncbi:hypothetical protein MNBD_PLANCTO02-2875 [hydrothermal vent metagenome]|uniref:Uncharacterized protein n=1 Tax=hydrothermal vent metagenome TaxID=652676 RepID=A0A3B1E2L7_9ZZZZ